MNEILSLVQMDGTAREVFCELRSVGRSEFYQANATGYKPELVFILADYLDYNDETLVDHDGKRYRVIRAYRKDQELELVVTRASAEESELNG